MSLEIIPHGKTTARMQATAQKAAKGVRDLEDMRLAAKEMDRIREEIRQRDGLVDIAVPLIRELCDR